MIEDITSLLNQIKIDKDIFQKSKLLDYIIKEKNLRITDLANKIGYKPSYICHLLRLKKVPDVIVDGYYSKSISSSHIYILSRLNDKKQMIELYEKILVENYTVKQTESAVREYLYQVKEMNFILYIAFLKLVIFFIIYIFLLMALKLFFKNYLNYL